ncbi:MAG: FMN-binding protein, partial [Methylococcales bacterium]|nr:FMN-binding protein [Methylococcales bacterium]MBT6794758.1 FMN-binding protein [Methylococcales bacterium]
GEVVNPAWRALWKGKQLYNAESIPVLRLVKGVVDVSRPGAEHQVDGLAGATLTSNGVSNLIRYWMGNEGFAPYLNKVRTTKGKEGV